ncbi:MAG: DUF2339 domain-containing protein [Sphingomonadaceae bacterium]|nr:DUF2339 domain-containing protein [Sphingomonadaceae bacterium]
MEALFILVLIIGLVVLFGQLSQLKQRVDVLEAWLARPAPPEARIEPAVVPAPSPGPIDPGTAFAWPEPPAPTPAAEPAPAAATYEIDLDEPEPPRESFGALFEHWVAGRLMIWLGGIALVLAAIFLIRYSIEMGLITPAARMIAAAIFGLVLVGAAEAARFRFSDDQRIAQALAGAGVATLYAVPYGSYALYGLIGSGTAFAAMVAVTAAALGLSLRHGAPTAVMGLVGGFLTPLLVGNPSASAVPLLAYLALLNLAIFAIAWRRGWTWLAAAGVLLSFAWTGYLITPLRTPSDALAAGLFVLLLGIGASVARPGSGRQLALIQPLAMAAVELAFLVARTDLGFQGWLLYGALGIASLVLALLRAEYRLAPPAALALALFLLFAKAWLRLDPYASDAAIGITLLFGGAGLALTVRRAEPVWTGLAAFALAGPLLIMRATQPELLELWAWGALAALLVPGPAALVWLNGRRASAEPPADLSLLIAGAAAALLAASAVWDLLPRDLAAAGWLAVAVAAALAARRLADLALATVSILTGVAGVARALAMVPQLSTALLTGLIGQPVFAADLPDAMATFYELALPAALLIALRLALPPLPLGARRALPVVAGFFAVSALYVWFKQAFGLTAGDDFVARGMIERTIVTQALFALGWLLGSGRLRLPRLEPEAAQLGAFLLTALATLRLVWLDLLMFDPAWTDQWVGPLPILNLILPAYLLSAVWLYAARRRPEEKGRSGLWLAAFLAALIAGAALLNRQLFHGAILDGPEMPTSEFYGYSLAGLVVAIGLIVAGMRLPDKALRLAGLVLLTATICKVFLVDASELKGVLRILSFLGLGIALIGIGRLYGPVLRAENVSA